MKIRVKILAVILLAGAILLSGCVSNPDPATPVPKPTETTINQSASNGNGIQTGLAVTEIPGKEKTDGTVKSSPKTSTGWIKTGPEKSFFSVDDLNISITVYQNIAIYTDKPTGNYILDTKITLRNIKSGQEFRTNYEILKNRLGGIAETPIDLNGNAKEWEWKVEFVKK